MRLLVHFLFFLFLGSCGDDDSSDSGNNDDSSNKTYYKITEVTYESTTFPQCTESGILPPGELGQGAQEGTCPEEVSSAPKKLKCVTEPTGIIPSVTSYVYSSTEIDSAAQTFLEGECTKNNGTTTAVSAY